MDRKGSSHLGSPDYGTEVTPEGGEMATYPRIYKETEVQELLAPYMAREVTA